MKEPNIKKSVLIIFIWISLLGSFGGLVTAPRSSPSLLHSTDPMTTLINVMKTLIYTEDFIHLSKENVVNNFMIASQMALESGINFNLDFLNKTSEEDFKILEEAYKNVTMLTKTIKTKIYPPILTSSFSKVIEGLEVIPQIEAGVQNLVFIAERFNLLFDDVVNEFFTISPLPTILANIAEVTKINNLFGSVKSSLENIITLASVESIKKLEKANSMCHLYENHKTTELLRSCLINTINAVQLPTNSSAKSWKDVNMNIENTKKYVSTIITNSGIYAWDHNSEIFYVQFDREKQLLTKDFNRTVPNMDQLLVKLSGMFEVLRDVLRNTQTYDSIKQFISIEKFMDTVIQFQKKYEKVQLHNQPVSERNLKLEFIECMRKLYHVPKELESVKDLDNILENHPPSELSQNYYKSNIVRRLEFARTFSVKKIMDGLSCRKTVENGFEHLQNFKMIEQADSILEDIEKYVQYHKNLKEAIPDELSLKKFLESMNVVEELVKWIKAIPDYDKLLSNIVDLKKIEPKEHVVKYMDQLLRRIDPVKMFMEETESIFSQTGGVERIFTMDEKELEKLWNLKNNTKYLGKLTRVVDNLRDVNDVIGTDFYEFKSHFENTDYAINLISLEFNFSKFDKELPKLDENLIKGTSLQQIKPAGLSKTLDRMSEKLVFFKKPLINLDCIKSFEVMLEKFQLFLNSGFRSLEESKEIAKLKGDKKLQDKVMKASKVYSEKLKFLMLVSHQMDQVDISDEMRKELESFFEEFPRIDTTANSNFYRFSYNLGLVARRLSQIKRLIKNENDTNTQKREFLKNVNVIIGDDFLKAMRGVRFTVRKFFQTLQSDYNCTNDEDKTHPVCRELRLEVHKDIESYGNMKKQDHEVESFRFERRQLTHKYEHQSEISMTVLFFIVCVASIGLVSFSVYISIHYSWAFYSDVSSKCSYVRKDKCFFTPFKHEDENYPNPFFTACDQEFLLVSTAFLEAEFVDVNQIPNVKSNIPLFKDNCITVGNEIFHASRIALAKKMYIASQLPDQDNCELFFDMIVQEKSTIVIQISAVEEDCLYLSELDKFGKYEIVRTKEKTEIKHLERYQIQTQQNFKFYLLHITCWSEDLVPLDITTVLDTMELSIELSEKSSSILVCCQNGCARTMTYISCIHIREMIETRKMAYFLDAVVHMRRKRYGAVNTISQYATIWMVTMLWRTRVDESKNEYHYRRLRELFLADLIHLNRKSRATKPVERK